MLQLLVPWQGSSWAITFLPPQLYSEHQKPTCLCVRVLNSECAAVLGVFRPRGGDNAEKRREIREEAILMEKLLCARHCAKDFSLIFSFKLWDLTHRLALTGSFHSYVHILKISVADMAHFVRSHMNTIYYNLCVPIACAVEVSM